jgi:transcriptional regulator with XRE-family HTH domain
MRANQARVIIGNRMRELRGSAGVTLKGASQLSSWDKGHLSRVERGLTKPSSGLVTWYDQCFGAQGALLRQFVELEASVRLDRQLALHDARERARRDGSGRRNGPLTEILGGSVPADFDDRDVSIYVGEIVPDGTILEPDCPFEKSWTLRNAGPVPWRDRWLTRQGTPGVPGWLASPAQVPVPDTDPGDVATMTVVLNTPDYAGTFTAYFKMTDRAGRLYFPTKAIPLNCTVTVFA